jgi:hypothetical protein
MIVPAKKMNNYIFGDIIMNFKLSKIANSYFWGPERPNPLPIPLPDADCNGECDCDCSSDCACQENE